METIRRFMDNELRLAHSIVPELGYKVFSELPPELQRRFELATLTIVRLYLPFQAGEDVTSFIIYELSRRINTVTRPLTATQLLFHGINTMVSRRVRELAEMNEAQSLFMLTPREKAEQLDKLVILGLYVAEITNEPIPYLGKHDSVYIATILGYDPKLHVPIDEKVIEKTTIKIRNILTDAGELFHSEMFRGYYYGKMSSKFRPMIALAFLYVLARRGRTIVEKNLDAIIRFVKDNYRDLSCPRSISAYSGAVRKLLTWLDS